MKRTLEKNLSNYFRYSSVMSNAHYDMAEIYRWRYRLFGLLVIVMTSIAGTAAIGSLVKLVGPDYESWINLSIGVLSLLATVFAALQTFLGYSDLQIQHKRAGDGYSVARREIESLAMKYPDSTGLANEKGTEEFDSLRKLLDNLDKTSPTLPDSIYELAAKKTPIERTST